MDGTQGVAKQPAQNVANQGNGKQEQSTQRTEPQFTLRPLVDIFENERGITLQADLPGVTNDRLNLQVDKDTLRVTGEAAIGTPEDMEALWAEVRSTRYERSFALSSELDTEKISAQMKNGVLTIDIPKRAEVQPRNVEVRVA